MKSMKHVLGAFILLGAFFASCKHKDVPVVVREQDKGYTNGIFIITEGAYGRTSGTVNFYKYGEDTIRTKVYEQQNPNMMLSNSAKTSTLEFATLSEGKLYLISKVNGPIVKLNAITLEEEGRYVQESSDWRYLLPLSSNYGLISAKDGVYLINLQTLSVQNRILSLSATKSGEMILAGNYIFVLHDAGTKVLSARNFSLVKKFDGINQGFTRTPDGKVWASTGSRLISFDKNLDTVGVALTKNISSWGYDYPTKMTASTKENVVFYANGKSIYRYVVGNEESLTQPFITVDVDPFIQYAAPRYDKEKNYIIVNGISGYGALATKNYFLLYDATTGSLVKKIVYGGNGVDTDFNHIYFPALSVPAYTWN